MRIPDSPPVIKPVPPGVHRPQWSVMIPAYNCSKYLPILLESLITQDLGPEKMQIEVVDDCSTDADVKQIVDEIGKGRIGYYRQPQNVGSLRNFETCLNRSTGEYIHLLHGDDRLLPGFYEKMTQAFEMYPQVGAVYCNHHYIDSTGKRRYRIKSYDTDPYILENWLETLAQRNRPQYVAMVVKRSVYEHLGGFYGVRYGEDWEMWCRIAKHYPTAYVPKILAEYRQHDDSISGAFYQSGQNIRDIAKVIDTINNYLPDEKKKRLRLIARKNYAYYAFARKHFLWRRKRYYHPGVNYIFEIFKMHTDPILIAKAIKLSLSIAWYRLTHPSKGPEKKTKKKETLDFSG